MEGRSNEGGTCTWKDVGGHAGVLWGAAPERGEGGGGVKKGVQSCMEAIARGGGDGGAWRGAARSRRWLRAGGGGGGAWARSRRREGEEEEEGWG